MLPTITDNKIDLPPGTRLHFPGTLADYEYLLAKLGDRATIRLRFRDNNILLMNPLPEHSNQVDILSDLIKTLLNHQDRDWHGFTPLTLRSSGRSGLEPDACFYLDNYQQILGKQRLDLNIDPPPDLAIEIDVTSFTRIEDYISLAIPEVWIYQQGKLDIYQFKNNNYMATDTSKIFPNFPVKEIIPIYVIRAGQAGSSKAIKEFKELLKH